MAIKRLSYPVVPKYEGDDRGVDTRLGEAHVHKNKSVIDDLTQEDLIRLRKSLDVDLGTLTTTGTNKIKSIISGAGYINKSGTVDGKNYLYTTTGWKSIDSVDVVTLSSDNTYVKLNKVDTNNYTIDLTDTAKANIANVNNKYDIVNSATASNITLFDSGNKLKDSGVNLAMLQTVANKSSAVDSNSTVTYATSKAVKIVNDRITALSNGLGKLRGCVYNAFSSSGSSYKITAVTITDKGAGYKTGDKFGIVGQVDAELTATANDEGQVISLFIDNGGLFDNDIKTTEATLYPKSVSGDGSENVKVTITATQLVPNTTLSDIDNPISGDTCYVNYDEVHNNQRSMYEYKAINEVKNGWVFRTSISAFPTVHVARYSL